MAGEGEEEGSTASATNGVLEKRIQELEKELQKAQEDLKEVRQEQKEERDLADSLATEFMPPPDKKGYLFQWQDRAIGWGGSKWSLLFVSLDHGRIAAYENHMDQSPVSVLTLRGCAVQDEGYKRNRRYKSKVESPPIDENGAYFHVFEIYHQPEQSGDDDSGDSGNNKYEASASLPLLRFSTTSLAEKNQWMELISETCAYCETETFMIDEAKRVEEKQKQMEQQAKLASIMPEASRGTLPALYFAPAVPELKQMQRRKSVARRRKSSVYRSKAKSRDADMKEAQYPPSKPMHVKAAPSFLSAEAPKQNYRGLFNLAMILLVISNFRHIVDTIREHGLAVLSSSAYLKDISQNYSTDPWRNFPFVTGFLMLQGFLVASFAVEWALSRNKISERLGMTLHNVISHATLLKSVAIVWNQIESPMVGGALLFYAVITWMKLISYSCANEDYRLAAKSGDLQSFEASLALLNNLEPEQEDIVYPENITLGNLYYFWLAPTLTYQITFPRTPRVRWSRAFGIFLGLFACGTLATFLVAQFITPVLSKLVLELEETGGVYTPHILAEYWLRLAITNTYLWLLMFYSYFHLYLNFWAEILRFGDRVFYKDWWNSSEVSSYWRLWNMPVHMWLVRHFYFPCIRMRMSKTNAMFMVFTLSAILHELLVSVPFHMIRPWSFLGMMGQIPLVAVTKAMHKKNPGSSLGNVTFWLSFCIVGQPMAILMYTADYQVAKVHAAMQMAENLKDAGISA